MCLAGRYGIIPSCHRLYMYGCVVLLEVCCPGASIHS